MSWQARLLSTALRHIEKRHLARAEDPVRLRHSFERKARIIFRAPPGTQNRWVALGAAWALEITGPWVRPGPAICYFHGGAFVMGSPHTHAAMLARLSNMTGARVLMVQYPLAPEHPFPAAFDTCLAAYHGAAAQGPFILGGDSAGGNLVMAVLAEALRSRASLPIGAFAFSPLTDLTFSGASITANAHADPLLPASRVGDTADFYLSDAPRDDPRASPLFADWAGAPPMWLAVDRTEILRDDTHRLRDRLSAAGGDVTLTETTGLPHVWPMFHNYLPEARQTLQDLAMWISRLSAARAES